MAEYYKVGEFYNIPTVHGMYFGKVGWWPVIGPKHEDAEIIGFDKYHYHVDWRFLSDAQVRMIRNQNGTVYSAILTEHSDFPLADVPTVKRRKCKRVGHYGQFYPSSPWAGKLEDTYDCKLVEGKFCPHKGFDLSTFEPNDKGQIVCPGHGKITQVESQCQE